MKKNFHLTSIMYLRYLVKVKTSHFNTFIMHSLNITRYIKHGVKHIKVHQVQRKQIDITKYV